MRVGFLSSYNPERIAFAKKWGFGCVELMTGYFAAPPEFMPGNSGWESKANEVKAAYAAADIRISCLGAFYLNHMDPKIEEQAKQQVRNSITLAAHLGVGVVAGFAGRTPGQTPEACLPKFKQLWGDHARFAKDHGVRIAFECCPMEWYSNAGQGINCICTPSMYEKCLDALDDTIGLEWDASHLVPVLIDPLENIRKFGKRIYHVHAKGAKIYWDVVRAHGIFDDHAHEHCFPGFGDEDWSQIVKELRRAGYHGDLNIEGWHDHVFRDQKDTPPADVLVDRPATAPNLEDAGLIVALNHLKQYCPDGF